jgi:hypothetical protein
MTKLHHSDSYYTIGPKLIDRKERKALYAKLKEHFKQGGDTAFKTKQDGLDALEAAGLSLDDYSVLETCAVSFGW